MEVFKLVYEKGLLFFITLELFQSLCEHELLSNLFHLLLLQWLGGFFCSSVLGLLFFNQLHMSDRYLLIYMKKVVECCIVLLKYKF